MRKFEKGREDSYIDDEKDEDGEKDEGDFDDSHPGPSGLEYMSGDISTNLGESANLCSPSPCNLESLFILPHPLLLLVLSIIIGFRFAIQFILLHLILVLLLL